MVEGIAPHSMVSEMLENNEEEVVIKSVAGTTYAGEYKPRPRFPRLSATFLSAALMLEAAVETVSWQMVSALVYILMTIQSSSALSAFMMAMVMFPDVQKKAQAEIDRVTGGSRMPAFSDRASMVYLEATYREVLRWCQVTPLGRVPFRASI